MGGDGYYDYDEDEDSEYGTDIESFSGPAIEEFQTDESHDVHANVEQVDLTLRVSVSVLVKTPPTVDRAEVELKVRRNIFKALSQDRYLDCSTVRVEHL